MESAIGKITEVLAKKLLKKACVKKNFDSSELEQSMGHKLEEKQNEIVWEKKENIKLQKEVATRVVTCYKVGLLTLPQIEMEEAVK